MEEEKILVLRETGEEVAVGDCLMIEIAPDNIESLIKAGILDEQTLRLPENVYYYVKHLAKRLNKDINIIEDLLNTVYRIDPKALYSILLTEIYLVTKSSHKDSLKDYVTLWTLDYTMGCNTIPGFRLKDFRGICAFRTYEEAKTVQHILDTAFKDFAEASRKKAKCCDEKYCSQGE